MALHKQTNNLVKDPLDQFFLRIVTNTDTKQEVLQCKNHLSALWWTNYVMETQLINYIKCILAFLHAISCCLSADEYTDSNISVIS